MEPCPGCGELTFPDFPCVRCGGKAAPAPAAPPPPAGQMPNAGAHQIPPPPGSAPAAAPQPDRTPEPSSGPSPSIIAGAVAALAVVLVAGFLVVTGGSDASDPIALADTATTEPPAVEVTIDGFCATPTPIADTPMPSTELGNLFAFFTLEPGFNNYSYSDLEVFDQAAFDLQDMPEVGSDQAVYIGCLEMEATGSDIRCSGYQGGVAFTWWGQNSEVDVYEIATARLVDTFIVKDVENPLCPQITTGTSRFQETSTWDLSLAVVDLAVPATPTLVGAYAHIDAADDWCGSPTPIRAAPEAIDEGVVAEEGVVADESVVVDEGAEEAVADPMHAIFVVDDVRVRPSDSSPVQYAGSLEDVDYVTCMTFTTDEEQPTVSCDYQDRVSYRVPNGQIAVTVIDPVTAEVLAESVFGSVPGCPGVLIGGIPDSPRPEIERSFFEWLATVPT